MEKRRMCPHCRAFIKTSDRVCPYCDTAVGPRAVDRRMPGEILGGFIPHARFTTTIILLINFGLFAATVLYSMGAGNGDAVMSIDGGTLLRFGAKSREYIVLAGQWWRLITASFLHGGLVHILLNSWVLFDVGAEVEEMYGSARLIVIYFVSTVFGFYASTLWTAALSIGASAGIMGLIGAMIALGVRHQSPMGSAIRGLYIRWAIYALLLGLLPFFNIDNAAHLGGLAAGFAVGYLCGTPRLTPTFAERFWHAAAWVSVGLTVLAFAKMLLFFRAVSAM